VNSFEAVKSRLVADRFPFRIAMFPNNLPDLGDVLEVHAFDVPEDRLLEVSQRLNGLLAAMRLTPMAIGMAFYVAESPQAESKVPSGALWLRPEHRPIPVPPPGFVFSLPPNFPKLTGASGANLPLRWSGTVVCEPLVSESVEVVAPGSHYSLSAWPSGRTWSTGAGHEPLTSPSQSVGAGILTSYSLAS